MHFKGLLRYGYVPFMFFGLNGAALLLVAGGAPYWTLGVVLAIAIGASFLAERILPYEGEWNIDHDDTATDITHFLVYEVSNINSVLMLPLIVWMLPWEGIWPTEWPLIVQFLIAVLVADFGLMMLHWLSHRWDFLWKLHSIHHGVSRLYGFNGLVRHPLHQTIDVVIGTAPLVLAGMPVNIAILLGLAISIQLIIQHSNVDHELGPFRNWMSIGHLHRLHHVNWGTEGDVNFGLFTTVWDRLLGTFQPEPPREIGANDMGIDEAPSFPKAYWDQLLYPFQSEETRAKYREQPKSDHTAPAE